MLMFYRLFVISCDHHSHKDDADEIEEAIYGDSIFMTSDSQMSSKDPSVRHNSPKRSQVSPMHRSMPSLRSPSRLTEQEYTGDMLMMVNGDKHDLKKLDVKDDNASTFSSPSPVSPGNKVVQLINNPFIPNRDNVEGICEQNSNSGTKQKKRKLTPIPATSLSHKIY